MRIVHPTKDRACSHLRNARRRGCSEPRHPFRRHHRKPRPADRAARARSDRFRHRPRSRARARREALPGAIARVPTRSCRAAASRHARSARAVVYRIGFVARAVEASGELARCVLGASHVRGSRFGERHPDRVDGQRLRSFMSSPVRVRPVPRSHNGCTRSRHSHFFGDATRRVRSGPRGRARGRAWA